MEYNRTRVLTSKGMSSMQKAGSVPPTCYFPDPDSSFDYHPRQEDQHGITDVGFAVLNDIEMVLRPEKRESRSQTAFEIVYRQDWPSEEKAYHLYQLHNAVGREAAEGRKEHHHISLDDIHQITRRVLRQPEADQ